MEHDYKYYNTLSRSIIIPKIYFCFKYNQNNSLFIFEWIEFICYYKKIIHVLEFYIFKCLVKNYYGDESYISARSLISKIIENLNFYIYETEQYEIFLNFDESVKRFNKIKDVVINNNDFPVEKKINFIKFIVSTVDILQELISIFEDYNIFYKSNMYDFRIYNRETPTEISYLPFSGGLNENKKLLKSFWVSQTCITNYQYLNFIENNGYSDKSLWSKEGNYWLKFENIKCPDNWECIDSKWFINGEPIDKFYNYPVQKISYFEAEACAKFYKARLPSEEEWLWISTNRNKTPNPYGIDIPFLLKISSEFSEITSTSNIEQNSLMNINNIIGNVWEFTSSLELNDKDIKVCTKGGDWKIPNFLINNNLKMLVDKDSRKYSIGFRLVKDKL